MKQKKLEIKSALILGEFFYIVVIYFFGDVNGSFVVFEMNKIRVDFLDEMKAKADDCFFTQK